MSAEKQDGGPAFPNKTVSHYVQAADGVAEPRYELTGGMSLRDWFAGQMLPRMGTGWPNDENKMLLARRCYEIADAMLSERAK